MANHEVSIMMLTHKALRYTRKTLSTLRMTEGVNYELVIVDNHSGATLRHLLLRWHAKKWCDKLCFMNYNSLFAEGNNIASRLAEQDSTYLLLLNSDIEIRDPHWLRRLIDSHDRGISSYGLVRGQPITRVDGYCLLIDSDLYRQHLLDEEHQWWWSVTKLQAKVLADGHSVKGYENHEKMLYHFGGKSGKGFKFAKGLHTEKERIIEWFKGLQVDAFDSLEEYEAKKQTSNSP
jgi:glycosyltransferase involved in cell wall biosynthesis